MKIIRAYSLTIAGVLVGTLGGYLYWHYIGCASGTCPITSNPLHATLYGSLMGELLFNIFQKDRGSKNNESAG